MDKKKRIMELDVMKGIGILIIAIYHIVYRPQDGIADQIIRSLGWGLISMFFLLAGYTAKPERSLKDNYKKRWRSLLLPTIFAETLLLVIGGIYCMIVQEYSFMDVVHDALVTFLRPEITTQISSVWGEGGNLFYNLSPVWFVWAMVWTELLFYPLAKMLYEKKTGWTVVVILALAGIQIPLYIYLPAAPWCLTVIPIYAIFMLAGAKLKEWKTADRLKRLPPIPATCLCILCFAAHFGLFKLNGNESYYVSEFGMNGAWDIPAVILQMFFFVAAMFLLARLVLMIPKVSALFIHAGQNTFTYLLWHSFYAMILCDGFGMHSKMGPWWYMENFGMTVTTEIFLKSLAICVLSLVCCMITSMIDKKLREIGILRF